MCFCNPLPHSVYVDVQIGKVFVKQHNHILGPPVRKGWNQHGSTLSDNFSNGFDESANFFFLGWMISTAIGAFNK